MATDRQGGADRIEVRRLLGKGGMGVVYEAFDAGRDELVAIKVMTSIDATALYRFKNEFRQLADLRHPNLVSLYELMARDGDWAFTMELVRGGTFKEYVQRHAVEPDSADDSTQTVSDVPGPDVAAVVATGRTAQLRPAARRRRLRVRLPHDMLLRAVDQLAAGVMTLHHAGFLHRDIKPSNVLVDEARHRVVLCDFGLVRGLADDAPRATRTAGAIRGTLAYMSPEQAAGLDLTEASDWYSLGVLLYEALTGMLPHCGTGQEILESKRTNDPLPMDLLDPETPSHLVALCGDLLAREPADRPTGADVLDRLDTSSRTAALVPARHRQRSAPFIGRDAEVAMLRDAMATARGGTCVTVLVGGESGVGKSELLRRFLDEVLHDGTTVLSGRCYQRESVPYKAIDAMIDALSTYLLDVGPADAADIVPDDVDALARLFPVLRRVPAVDQEREFGARDPHELRRRAFGALRAVLSAIAERGPLVLSIDDLQWGDTDSGRLLREVLHAPGAPALLLVASYRSEECDTSPLLRMLLPREGRVSPLGDVRSIALAPLPATDARDLAVELLGDVRDASAIGEAIAREAAGSPYFVAELAHHALSGAGVAELSLRDALLRRVKQLPREAGALLEHVAVAGRPIGMDLALTASGLDARGRDAAAALRAERFARAVDDSSADRIECYHDRVRETVVAALTEADLRARHGALALALEQRGAADPELLFEHWSGAGDDARAARYAEQAADQAAEGLAFDRAARLYARAAELGADSSGLRARLAEALANTGRLAEAAQAFEVAVAGADPDHALELRRRAAEEWLHAGQVDRGRAVFADVLASFGMQLARTPRRALASLVWRRAALRLRGTRFTLRDPTDVSAHELIKVDALWTVAGGLGVIDTIRGADFQTRHIIAALSTGEPFRVVRGLAMEAAYQAFSGHRTQRRADRLLARAAALADAIADPHAAALCHLIGAVIHTVRGQWRGAHDASRRADALLRRHCTGVAWELTNGTAYRLSALLNLGELGQLRSLVPDVIRDAEERGDLFGLNMSRGAITVAELAADEPARARAGIDDGLRQWSASGYHLQHLTALLSHVAIDLYEGNGPAAHARILAQWPDVDRSLLLRVQFLMVEALHLRASTAVAAAGPRASDRERLLDSASRDARRIGRVKLPWARALATKLHAAVALARGRDADGVALLASAESLFRGAEMALFAHGCQLRRAACLGGDEGAALAAEALEALTALGAERPDAIAETFVPPPPR